DLLKELMVGQCHGDRMDHRSDLVELLFGELSRGGDYQLTDDRVARGEWEGIGVAVIVGNAPGGKDHGSGIVVDDQLSGRSRESAQDVIQGRRGDRDDVE